MPSLFFFYSNVNLKQNISKIVGKKGETKEEGKRMEGRERGSSEEGKQLWL